MHTATRQEVSQAAKWYGKRSDRSADRFVEEVNEALERIAANPTHFHFAHENVRRCNLSRFPYHILFEVHLLEIFVMTIKHHRKHPAYGLRRRSK